MCLAAENGTFLRFTTGEWMTAMPNNLNMDWVESVKVRWCLDCKLINLNKVNYTIISMLNILSI